MVHIINKLTQLQHKSVNIVLLTKKSLGVAKSCKEATPSHHVFL